MRVVVGGRCQLLSVVLDQQLYLACKLQQRSIRRYKKRKAGNVLFNDAFNTFYLRLYGVWHMVKDHSDSERGNSLPLHRILFPISSKVFILYTSSQRQNNTYHGLCYTSRGALAGKRNSSIGPPRRIDPTTHRKPCSTNQSQRYNSFKYLQSQSYITSQ